MKILVENIIFRIEHIGNRNNLYFTNIHMQMAFLISVGKAVKMLLVKSLIMILPHQIPDSEGRNVFPCDFRAKIDFFALNDCMCVMIMKNDGVQFFGLLEPILWALFLGHAHFCA